MATTVRLLFLSIAAVHLSTAASNISAVFAFGDSILDAGNNNRLLTAARADHPPYGIIFPGGIPTGRFSDGKLATDIIVSDLGIKPLLPAYLDPSVSDVDLLTGATFASAGSGLDELTTNGGNFLSLENQLECFQEALGRMRRAADDDEVDRVVGNAVFMVSIGSNDMLKNYYTLSLRRKFTVSEYQDFLLKKLEGFIKSLLSMGARKVAVIGFPPLGCLPLQITLNDVKNFRSLSYRTCVIKQNSNSEAYNAKLQALLSALLPSLPNGTKLAYVDAYTAVMDMITNPSTYGFEETLEGCCGKDVVAIGPLCNILSVLCPNPDKYLFWDSAHPSQAAYTILARQFLKDVLPKLV